MHKKILLAWFMCGGFFPLFAQNKPLIALQLDFTRTETRQQQTGTMRGHISFVQNPFVFVFETTSPERQCTYLNADGAFLTDGKTVYDISAHAAALQQTCTDFLTWFKSDLALRQEGYESTDCFVRDGAVVSRWKYTKTDAHPISVIEVTTNAQGIFEHLRMFSAENELITETHLSAFVKNGAYSYPTHIQATYFADGEQVSFMTLQFFNVRCNQPAEIPLDYAGTSLRTAAVQTEKNAPTSFEQASVPAPQTYRVSIPSVATGAGFALYKKYITSQDMSKCPYDPSCSQYMLQAVSEHGLWGVIQGLERKRRCTTEEHKRGLYPDTPRGKHYDPVEKD